MSRPLRLNLGNTYYHALNRGNQKARVFHDDADYARFIRLLAEACERYGVRVLAFVLMPNHFHLLLFVRADGDLAKFMHVLTTMHATQHHARHGTTGHVWQGRYKSSPIHSDRYLLAAAAYVERNALRGGLVTRAEEWPWGSAYLRARGRTPPWLLPPLEREEVWVARLNERKESASLHALRSCVQRGRPFGPAPWVKDMLTRLGLPLE